MTKRSHRSRRKSVGEVATGRRRHSRVALAFVVVAVPAVAAAGAWLASVNGWPPFDGLADRPGVSLVPSRTGIPLPPRAGDVAIFEPAPTATGNSDASPGVFACIEKLYVNNDVLQPLRRDLDFQIWHNPSYNGDKASARYLFRLRDQIQRSSDAVRMIAQVRACTALE